ncbi:MAG: molybdopterin-dependent oxidoreductase [Verrucomicrobiales bacterium]|nr:molybdopterin-dependent oxidoreductase [Verrucomicrobiales bacterium]
MPDEAIIEEPPAIETIPVKVDGQEISVPKLTPDWQGKLVPTTVLQACKHAGIEIPHYCYHPKLPVAGNCRMCLVHVGMPGRPGPDGKPPMNEDGSLKIDPMVLPYERGTPKGVIGCATNLIPGMEIYASSPETKEMREAVLESLLINHPLDCTICDQAGECKLQEYSMEHGQAESQFAEQKVHKPKAVDLGPRIVLDAERCVLCTRCIRFSADIAGDDALGIVNRGSYNSIATFPGAPFDNNYTLNTADICPVGALTSKDFRFQMRVWFLKETNSLCTGCATGCNTVIGSRENKMYRQEPRENDAVNGPWMCDSGRLDYKWIGSEKRLSKLNGTTDWTTILAEITTNLEKAAVTSVAIIASARQTNEELFLLKKLADKFEAITDSVPRNGEGDHLLVNADKNPNSNGARLIGIAGETLGANLPAIAEGIGNGTIKSLIVFGEDVTQHGISAALLEKLDLLIVSDIFANATTARAHYLLPGCAYAEKRGTFTNVKGQVQKFMKALDAPGNARAEWEFLHEIVENVTGQNGFSTIEGLFNQMAGEVDAFKAKELNWAALGDDGVTVEI